jgi:thioredoxin 1
MIRRICDWFGTLFAFVVSTTSWGRKMNYDDKKPRILEVSQSDFDRIVLRSSGALLVAFCAPWSRPCRVIDSTLEKVAAACKGRAEVARVNADDNPELSLWYDIQSIPTLLFFVSGVPIARLVGTASREAILAKLEAVLKNKPASLDLPQ